MGVGCWTDSRSLRLSSDVGSSPWKRLFPFLENLFQESSPLPLIYPKPFAFAFASALLSRAALFACKLALR